jgi:hypothetical protein
MVLAGLLPLGLLGLVGLRKRSVLLRGSILAFICMLAIGTMSGCSSGTSMAAAPTPPSTPPATPMTSHITITATSGMLSHSVSVNLTTN